MSGRVRSAWGRHGEEEGVVADLRWDDVKWFFDPVEMGSLPDVCVPDTSVENWQAVLDLVREQGWTFRYSEGGMVLPLPRAETVLSRSAVPVR